jgi:hypothetical protein
MAVISYRELARNNTHRFGESPIYRRQFVCTLDTPETASTDMVTACGVAHGAAHPEWALMLVHNLELEEQYEGSRYHALLTAEYELPAAGEVEQSSWTPSPLTRPDEWSFQTQGAAVPAFFYFDGATKKPLTNSAYDFYQGLTVDEAQTKVIITGNRATFPSAIAAAVTNCVNGSAYLGGGENTWKCQGISGTVKYELVNSVQIKYWEVKAELLYRQTGWNLLLPDIGFNYLEGGEKKRATVKDEENGEYVASANPVALNGSGAQTSGAPAILNRRIYKQIDFSSYFGTPPT